MTTLRIQGSRDFREFGTAERIFHRPRRPREIFPVQVWPGQDFTALYKGYNRHAADPTAAFSTLSELNLYLFALHDAWFTIENGLDGVIFDRDGWIVNEPSCFRRYSLSETGRDLGAEISPIVELDDVFIGPDAAWGNYYHFLCYGMACCYIARNLVPESCALIMPDYESRKVYSNLSFSQSTYDQAFELSGLSNRVTKLPVGLYHANTLRFLWTDPREPPYLLEVPAFQSMFDEIRRSLTIDPNLPKRLLVSRSGASDSRMGTEAHDLVRRMCADRGFSIVKFEEMDLRQQAQALFNADCIVAPHGAGLVNTMFGRQHLRILELNTELDDDGSTRACFYQLAAERNQLYMSLNGSRQEINPASLARALDICCCGPLPT